MNGVRVPASTSNLGAGFDCLGLALDLWLDARLVAGSGPPVYSGTMAVVDPTNDIVHRFTGDLTERNLHLEVHSDIPIAKGLGSSAAAVVAGITLRSLARGEPPSAEAVYREAVAAEGHPDNTGPAVYGGLVLSAHRPERLGFSDDLAVALAIPEQAIDTRAARAILPSDLPRDTAIAQAASAAALLLGLTSGNGDLIAFGMDDHIAAPVRKNLIPGYDDAVHAGREAGACGVTISGSGSTLVAIGPRSSVSDVAQAMAAALSSAGNRSQPCTPRVSERGMEVRRET